MKKIIRRCVLVLLAAVWISGGAQAGVCPPAPQKPTEEMVRAGMRAARDHGFLWRISKDGRTSYLYGTMHIAKYDWMFPGPSVMQALISSDIIALEIDVTDAGMEARLEKGMASLHGTALPKPLEKRMRQYADTLCVPYTSVAGLAPEFQVSMLSMMAGRWDGLDAAYAVDRVLAIIGHRIRKDVVSVETPESQLGLLHMKTPQDTVSFVQDGLTDLETGHARALLKRLARSWADSDYTDMAQYREWCGCLKTTMDREMMKRTVDERNPNLAARIDALHTSGKQVFAAVGSLHMFGPLGLPALMEQRGYRVERMDLNSQHR